MSTPHFKSAVTAVSSASYLSKRKEKLLIKHRKSLSSLDDCTDHFHREPPQDLAAKGNLPGLEESVAKFGLTMRESDKNSSTLLHHAARSNQVRVMKYLLEHGVELDATDKHGDTALHLAAREGHVQAIHLLLESGADISIFNSEKEASVHTAAMEKSGQALQAIVEHHFCKTCRLKGFRNRTILHYIAAEDNMEACKVLQGCLAKVPDKQNCLHLKDDDGLTPIHLAAQKNAYQVLEFFILLCKEHSLDTALGFVDEENSTPLHAAVDAGHLEVACVLLKYGACPMVMKGDIPPPLHLACSQGRLDMIKAMTATCGKEVLHSIDQNQRLPLHYSAFSIHSKSVISFIMEERGKGFDIDQQDTRGRTPLHMSISSGNLTGVKDFLERGADPLVRDSEGHNALHLAILHNRKAIIEVLCDTPHSEEMAIELDSKGYSPVHIGLKLGLKDIVQTLTSSIQVEPRNVKDPHGNNCIHLAASSGDWKALSGFLELSNSHKLLNETNNSRATPLHCAAKNGHSHCVELLLSSGAMVHKSNKGVYPLMLACRGGHMESLMLLYKAYSFQIDWQDDAGESALHYAARSGSPAMIQKVLDLGAKIVHNDNAKSFLDIVISSGNEDCGLAIVNHRRWWECLDEVSTTLLEYPMLSLVRQMPNIAKAVLDRCHQREYCNGQMKTETFNFKYLVTPWNKPLEEPQKTTEDTMGRQTTSEDRKPRVLARRKSKKLQQEVVIEDLEQMDSDMKIMTLHHTVRKTKSAASTTNKRKPSRTMEVLKTMIRHKRIDLLIHPVVNAYLRKKWKSYGRFTYAVNFGILSLLVFSLTMFVVLSPNPTLAANGNNSGNATSFGSGNNSGNASSEGFYSTTAAQVFRWLSVLANTLYVINAIAGVLVVGLKSVNFVKRIEVWITVLAVLFNYVFLLSPDPYDVSILPFGAAACYFTWLVMFTALEFFDVFGIYVNMFFKILRTVFQVFFVCLLLLFAFGLAMYILAGRVTDFSNIGYSFFSVFGYMLGEVQYSLFIQEASKGSLQHSEFIIFVIFILAIMMSIVMANLLIGLAVGDIENIKLNALYNGRVLEVTYFTHIDHYAPKCMDDVTAPQSHTISHKHCDSRSFLGRMTDLVKDEVLDMAETHMDEESQHTSPDAPVDIALEMTQIKLKLQEMSDMLYSMKEGEKRSRRQCFRGKKQQSTLSIDSDISMTPSDFMTDLV